MLQRGWYRLNLHLLAGLVLPQLAGGRRVGALLVGEHLDDEVRGERTTATEAGMFPGLGPLRDRAEQLAIEQVVLPDTFGGIAAVLAQAWKISLKSLALMLRRPRVCKFSRGQLDRAELVDAFARLATVDVLRAISARHATRDFLGRYRLREGLVLSSGSELAAEAAADLTLQEAGLSTTEFLHGAGAEEWVSPLQTPSALVATWTEVDARELRALGHQTTCMGMPWEASSPREKPGRPVRVLLATNYVHRDYEIEGEFPYHTFLVDLLRLPERLEGLATGEFKVRWRPHPAEKVEALLDAEQKAQARPDRSVDSLADDLEWADVVVS
ncbi:MAG: hypothetical protein KC910_37535, partial [Candidatus Eremiobacteraeota bacterium]|nr:hypothetical protein [Candidatus Eremiobacteraeota bacterium]